MYLALSAEYLAKKEPRGWRTKSSCHFSYWAVFLWSFERHNGPFGRNRGNGPLRRENDPWVPVAVSIGNLMLSAPKSHNRNRQPFPR